MKGLKIITIGILAIAFQMSITAQETPTGKKFAETFWKAISEGRENAAKSALDSVKRREPNFDASKMESALAELKGNITSKREAGRDATRANIDARNILEKLFESNIQTDSFAEYETIKSSIDESKKLTAQILAMDPASIQKHLDSALHSIEFRFTRNPDNHADTFRQINEAQDSRNAEAMYFELLLNQEYWDAARKIFPTKSNFSKAYNEISSAISKLGTPEQRAKTAAKNLTAKIDSERMPKAEVNDAKLEKLFEEVFNAESKAKKLDRTFLRSVIISSDYYINRHKITGIILGRYRNGSIAYKDGADGKCKYGQYSIYQEYVGGRFAEKAGGSYDLNVGEIRCQNVNAK